MILIGIGANLASVAGSPRETCEAALADLQARGIAVEARSPWYETAPVPASDQPWFINAVAIIATDLSPAAVLALMQEVEAGFGRQRAVPNEPRVLDLDLLAYGDLIQSDPRLTLPHPRLHERAFVLYPLRDIAPAWRHPQLGKTAHELASMLPSGQEIRRADP